MKIQNQATRSIRIRLNKDVALDVELDEHLYNAISGLESHYDLLWFNYFIWNKKINRSYK